MLTGEVTVLRQQLMTEHNKRVAAEQALRDKQRDKQHDTTPLPARSKRRDKPVATPDERRAWV